VSTFEIKKDDWVISGIPSISENGETILIPYQIPNDNYPLYTSFGLFIARDASQNLVGIEVGYTSMNEINNPGTIRIGLGYSLNSNELAFFSVSISFYPPTP
jgi:hypothetical protein